MQNSATPNDLVRKELSARIETLYKDTRRLENELSAAERGVKNAEEALQDNEERIEQFLAARLSLEPESAFSAPAELRILLEDVAEMPQGTVARVVFNGLDHRSRKDWLVTTDLTLPQLPNERAIHLALFDPKRTVWVDEHSSRPYEK